MASNYQSIAFGEETKKLQEKYGSRSSYARVELTSYYDGLTKNEIAFISERDGFYIASNGHDGYPYIQYRGGPAGFLGVIDNNTLGFLDFRGNKQYISTGNVKEDDKVALMIMDYARKARLKIYAKAEIIDLGTDAALEEKLAIAGYNAKPERIIKLHIQAYDWNCPQHIVQRFTIPEIEDAFAAQKDYIQQLRAEIERLKNEH
jgi:predicted pyridoxine 5'-phosphate oxidase superfamily flavin-nucleotide-binding protein